MAPSSPTTPAPRAGSSGSARSSGSGAAAPPAPTASGPSILDDTGIRRALMRIAHEIVERNADPGELYLVAIPNGGVPLGRLLVENIEKISERRAPLGILDTTLYRDDLATSGERPPLRKTEMPSSVDGRVVVLVEDVVNTGRTIRAAMDALMEFGRPTMVQAVALVDRGHRELPIKIDFVGKNIPTQAHEKVHLVAEPTGREPMCVVLETSEGRDAQGGGQA